jgi:hypothetical protein
VEIEWWTVLEKQRIEVVSRIEVTAGVEKRTHAVTSPVEVEAFEGSYPLGLDEGEHPVEKSGKGGVASQARRGRIESRMLTGYKSVEAVEAPGNVLAARSVVHMLRADVGRGRTVLSAEFRSVPF